jgi:hypothetical protein
MDVAHRKIAQKSFKDVVTANHLRGNDDDVSDDDLTYITQQLEQRRVKDKVTDKLKVRLCQNGDVPYQVQKNENTSCTSLPGEKKVSFLRQNRIASAPNLDKPNLTTKEEETIELNGNKVKFLSPAYIKDEKEPVMERNGKISPAQRSIDEHDRLSTMSSKSALSSIPSSLFSSTRHRSRKLGKARKYGRLQMVGKAFIAMFRVARGKFLLHCVSFLTWEFYKLI